MDSNPERQYDERDRNDIEPGTVGSTSPGVETTPRGNPEADREDVARGEEKLDRIVNW